MPLFRTTHPVSRPLISVLRRWSPLETRQSLCGRLVPRQTRSTHKARYPNHKQSAAPHPTQQNLGRDDLPVLESLSDAELKQIPEEVLRRFRVKVRYLRPAIWAISTSVGIYVFLAYLEAREQIKPKPAVPAQFRRHQTSGAPGPTDVLVNFWNSQDPISKLSLGIIATNGAVHLSSFLVPGFWMRLWHLPAMNVNYSLFTSMFVHSGPLHLLFNMWACYNFLLPVGYSKLFAGDPYHMLSFFLSTGVLSGYGQHLATIFSSQTKALRARAPPEVFIRCGGASGALFGVFAAFCMQYPNAGVGIIFVPISIAASTMLPCVMAFDLLGMVRGFGLGLGHAVSTDRCEHALC